MDQKAWNEDMMACRARRSTSTACAFMATSIAPIDAPTSTAMPKSGASVVGNDTRRRNRELASAVTRVTLREPLRPIYGPSDSMAAMEPSPNTTMTLPIIALSMLNRSRTIGM